MNKDEITVALGQTLEDRRLSRGEKRALKEVLADVREGMKGTWRASAFALAGDAIADAKIDTERREVLDWLEDVVKLLEAPVEAGEHAPNQVAEVIFSPGDGCRARIASLLAKSRKSADICVFTITDDRLARPIVEAHRRGIRVRIITDDDKSQDLGSDIEALRKAGVPVRVDHSEHHMHHKYAVFDGAILLTGSYNWTRSAAKHNRENVVVTDDPRLVRPFVDRFAETWDTLK